NRNCGCAVPKRRFDDRNDQRDKAKGLVENLAKIETAINRISEFGPRMGRGTFHISHDRILAGL
ncbi:hypothetical protein N8529_01115, partial [bacterium]|nr:hypothetical protein [bacterium]